MKVAISKKSALFGTELKFVLVIGSEVGPTSIPKNPKCGVIGFFMEQSLKRGLKLDNFARKAIDQKGSSNKRLIPKFYGHRGLGKKRQAHCNYMSMFSLC